MADRLKSKRAIVIGAGQTPGDTIGNGKAISFLFAKEGSAVLCVDRDPERAEETASEIRSQGGVAFSVGADVTDADDCARVAAAAVERFGGLDILVNNVGIGSGDGPAHVAREDLFDKVMTVNVKGMWLMTKAALGMMIEQRAGSIINISSVASLVHGSGMSYEVSKGAVNRLTTHVAQSYASRRIRCNAILPGLMDTPMAVANIAARTGRDQDVVRAERNARVPLGGKMGTAWDTAHAALYLASDEAGFVTGALLPVDGGRSVTVAEV